VTDVIDVFVEIPRGSRNKYEFDHERHVMRLDRRPFTATAYPADYGFVPDTLAEDGDPLDALVLLDEPTFPGCLISARPIGVFWMSDDAGPDAKILCVPATDPRYVKITGVEDVPDATSEIGHFFEVYKAIEPHKHTDVRGWAGAEAAVAEIEACRRRFVDTGAPPTGP
jgi:inorganic pyrophosphatase